MLPKPFYYNNDNQEQEPTEYWNNFLGTLGMVPKEWEKFVFSLLADEKKNDLKYIICDISHAIMETNREIWKTRCKMLYNKEYAP